ncbi:helix-turn-helix domain-containing protein [Liquorilactobacillus mali]|uniref:helix-turn-helix domain-containing protein n=1 Tax=Liquorilactobacillus mali TaxID=1618 RepID=UPI002350B98F|nr:helix-turn-helix domain-containing protein [Liquorilactobacillus mali]MDC7952498.1 helix-turn-helix domain-containing protein [Liquorilactobacillus mali]
MTAKTYPRFMTMSQACEYLNIKSVNTLKDRYIADGLKVTVVGSVKRIDIKDIDSFMEEHKI